MHTTKHTHAQPPHAVHRHAWNARIKMKLVPFVYMYQMMFDILAYNIIYMDQIGTLQKLFAMSNGKEHAS